jgi:hypothetical protein
VIEISQIPFAVGSGRSDQLYGTGSIRIAGRIGTITSNIWLGYQDEEIKYTAWRAELI